MTDPPDGWSVVHRSRKERPARERALVLAAREIPHALSRADGEHVLLVPEAWRDAALEELASYEQENRGWPPRLRLPPAAPGAGASVAVYAGLLVLVHAFATGRAFGLDWDAAGASDAGLVRAGAWWRAVTSLTLHVDAIHLLSNVFYGSLFGFLAVYSLGGGLGWLTVLCAGVLGNLTNAWIQGAPHVSVGASTAVFGAIGVLAGAELHRRLVFREPRLRLAAPVVVAVLLLSYLGVGDARTDVLAHVTGLFWGLPLGWASAGFPRPAASRAVQGALGALALFVLGLAWTLAFASTHGG